MDENIDFSFGSEKSKAKHSILVCWPHKIGEVDDSVGGHFCCKCGVEVYSPEDCYKMLGEGIETCCVHCAAADEEFWNFEPKIDPRQVEYLANKYGTSYDEAMFRCLGILEGIKAEFTMRRLIAISWTKKFNKHSRLNIFDKPIQFYGKTG